jgi:hypothetical protein
MPEVSAFKQLVTSMFTNGGDFSKLPSGQRSQAIKCYVKESFPYFLVSDNYHYLPVYFTKKAVDDFKGKSANVNITDLKSRVITITDWSLEMVSVNSQDVFTSYGGLEVRLVAKAFKAEKGSDKVVLSRHPTNLYRDAEVKTIVQAFSHRAVVAGAGGAKAGLPDISSLKSSGNVSQGVVSSAAQFKFKAGNTAVVTMEALFKQEKGASAFSKLSVGGSSGRVKATGGAKANRSKSAKKGSTKKGGAVNALMRSSSANNKKSVTLGARGPNVQSPGNAGADGSANISSMKDFKKMVNLIKSQKNRSNTPGGKKSQKK